MVQALEAIKGGGGSIKVGTTGTISALMSKELQSAKNAPPHPAPSTTKSQKTAVLEPDDAAKPKARVQADEASTSGSSSGTTTNVINGKQTGVPPKPKHHHARRGSKNPILHSDNVSVDGTPNRRKRDKKGFYIVEVVDVKCGMPDKTWTNPLTNRLKKLSFSKLSETSNGVG